MLALIVFGMNNELEPIGQVDFNCPNCGYTPTNLYWSHRKATVYWIPLFGMGKSYAIGCDNCGFQSEIEEQLGQQLQQSIGSAPANTAPQPQPAPYTPPAAAPAPAPAPARANQPTYNQNGEAPWNADDRPTTVLSPPPLIAESEDASTTRRLGSMPMPVNTGTNTGQTVKCANCGAAVPAGAGFCQNCGAQVNASAPATVRACHNCGYVQSTGAFCNNCGTPFPEAPTS